jgi:hypothetical protein
MKQPIVFKLGVYILNCAPRKYPASVRRTLKLLKLYRCCLHHEFIPFLLLVLCTQNVMELKHAISCFQNFLLLARTSSNRFEGFPQTLN